MPGAKCAALSYGISTDWTFDLHLKRALDCEVHLFDPTIAHPSVLDGMPFHYFGAAMLPEMTVESIRGGSVPLMAAAIGHPHYHVLKMDCEGCEFKLAESIHEFGHKFLDTIDQLAIEVHTCHHIMEPLAKAEENWGALVVLLERAGFKLMHYFRTRCGSHTPPHVSGMRWIKVRRRECCHNMLFAHPERVMMLQQ